MIRYALACEASHEFESWFPDSAAYDEQAARGLVTCPLCGSGKIEKQIMAPSLARSDKAVSRAAPQASTPVPQDSERAGGAAAEAPQPVALLSERERELRAMFKAFREHVTKTSDYVGPQF